MNEVVYLSFYQCTSVTYIQALQLNYRSERFHTASKGASCQGQVIVVLVQDSPWSNESMDPMCDTFLFGTQYKVHLNMLCMISNNVTSRSHFQCLLLTQALITYSTIVIFRN